MKPLIFTLWLLHGADAATTDIGIAKGAHEIIAPVNKPWQLNTIDFAEAAYEHWMIHKLNKHHPRIAKTLIIGIDAAQAIAVGLNIKTIRKK